MPDEIVLSDGLEWKGETLGIFELDNIPLPNIGPFTYEMEMVTGDKREVELDLSRYEKLPEKPDIPESEIVESSPAWYRLREWQLVQAGLLHNRMRLDAAHEYCEKLLFYIRDNVIAVDDLNRIKTVADFKAVAWRALVAPLTREILADTLRTSFNASYDDEEIFDAMDKTSAGLGTYNAIRLWENQIANALGLRDYEYAQTPLDERSRRVCAYKLPTWLETLEISRSRRRQIARGNANAAS